ncbi:hypothetical protein [Alkalibacterium sp. 20]|uniref:hypothetical protein n=1 Tax=Alkalibacterium sp. 20 TaxID=1798803 RepID=UPI0009001A2A|nr:hypothetical protein [Alkalibacterium sp. 20]OJF91850.1 hypothetical protein AX762_10595 [Alkalibacterium sp. 20]
MENIVANPMFIAIVTLMIGVSVWFGLSDESTEVKKSVASVFMDNVFYFVMALFGINALLNFNEIIQVPYRILLFSSNVVWIATLGVLIYGSYLYGEKFWTDKTKAKSVAKLVTTIGLVNHAYMYYRYTSVNALLFIILFVGLLALLTFTPLTRKVSPFLVLVGFGVVHLLIMGTRSVIYFNFVFSPLAILSLFLVFSGLLWGYKRRMLPSKQN